MKITTIAIDAYGKGKGSTTIKPPHIGPRPRNEPAPSVGTITIKQSKGGTSIVKK